MKFKNDSIPGVILLNLMKACLRGSRALLNLSDLIESARVRRTA